MKNYFGFGKKGELLAFGEFSDRAVRHELLSREHPRFAEVSMSDGYRPSAMRINAGKNFDEELRHAIVSEYRSVWYGKRRYGPFGDIISAVAIPDLCEGRAPSAIVVINYIAPQTFEKPGLGADLVIIVTNETGVRYFVGIRRTNEPGIGKPATIGGFLDVKDSRLLSPLQTILHESRDEAGITITTPSGEAVGEQELLTSEKRDVRVALSSGDNAPGTLKYLGVIPTGDVDRLPSGRKRIYWAFGYVLEITIPAQCSSDERMVARCFRGSEEGAIYVRKIGATEKDHPRFHSSHHREFFEKGLREAIAFRYPPHT